jgi:hypothetical protein
MSPRHFIWLLAFCPAGAAAADWSLSMSGGITTFAGVGEQPFASVAVYRYFGAGFVRVGVAWFDGEGDPDVAEPLPADTRQVTIGGGYLVGRVLLDAFATLGDRDFTTPGPDRTSGRLVRDDTDGGLFSLGGSATWDAPAGDLWSVAPFVTLSYSEVDTARTMVPQAGDPIVEEMRENGLIGIAGVSAERVWAGGSLGVYLAAAATSNRAAINRQGSGGPASRASQLLPAEDEGDGWFEYGVSGSIQLSSDVSLDALIVRTAGFSPSETTSASAGIRVQF